MKKYLLLVGLVIMICISSIAVADLINPGVIKKAEPEQISAVLSCSRAIRYNNVFQRFYNAKGLNVYPISYNGTTYLPIRAISSMFKQGIEWNGDTKSIYLGKGEVDTVASKDSDVRFYVPIENITAVVNSEITIYYNDKVQSFKDANGKTVLPISYQGTTYLPVRAIANLFGANIEYESILDIVDITK